MLTKDKKDSSKEMEITVKLTAGIPYKWVYEIEDENIVRYKKHYTLKDENVGAISGAPVYINFVFEGVKPGKTKVTLKYINIDDENDVMEKIENIMKVDKFNNISIVALDE